MGRKPYSWSRKPTFVRRTIRALADSARDRAAIARRKALMRLKGHKYACKCGRTFRAEGGRDVCAVRHQREKTRARGNGRAKAPGSGFGKPAGRVRPGNYTDLSTGRTFHDRLHFNDAARQQMEREDRAAARTARAETREQERTRRAEATKARAARNGRPAGAPKKRTTKLRTGRDRAEWHAQRTQMAAGRMDRDGNRTGHEPSPPKVRPRTPREPATR